MTSKKNKAAQVADSAKKDEAASAAAADVSSNVTQPVGEGSLAQIGNPDLTQEQNATSSDAISTKRENIAGQVDDSAKKDEAANAAADVSPNVAQPEGKDSLAQNDNPDLTPDLGATSSDATSAKHESIAGLEVQSKQAGFRRAGRAWPSEATFVALDELTDEQIAALEAEPLLIVKRVEG